MAGSRIDLSNENMELGSLSRNATSVGMILLVVGLVATLAMGALTGGAGHDSLGHDGGAHGEDHGADHGSEAHDDHVDDHAGEHDSAHAGHDDHHHAHGYISERSWLHPYLISYCYFLAITIGALFFVIIHHLVRAGWSSSLRRIAEGVSQNFIVMAVLTIPILLNLGEVYQWAVYDVGHDPLIDVKQAYLNEGAFITRFVAYFAVWIGFSVFFHRMSVKQDETGDPAISRKMGLATPVAVLLFALSVSFAGFDLLMSLDAHWFSTIFGVYFFAGCVLSWHAFLALTVIWLQKHGRLVRSINSEHLQDVGKMVFAFTIFWAYVAFSQYMLYWYGNIPEETGWYLRRQTTFTWGAWGFFLVFGHFAVPFLFLLSKHVKRRKTTLAVGAIWMLLVHWCDLYYLVMPQLMSGSEFPFQMIDVTIFLAMTGLYLITTAWFLGRAPLLAKCDSKLPEALAFHNA
jgi:hypothetical protein